MLITAAYRARSPLHTERKRAREVKRLKKVRMARDGYVLISIIFYVAGIVCMAVPSVPPLVLYICGGILLIVYGIVKMIGYCSDDMYDLAFQYDLACGLFLIVLGVIVLGCNLRIRPYLHPGLGLLILLDAVLKIQTAKDAKVFGLETWKRILIFSVIAAAFGVLMIIRPFSGRQTSNMILGCGLFAEGIMNHLTVKETVKVTKRFSHTKEEENG